MAPKWIIQLEKAEMGPQQAVAQGQVEMGKAAKGLEDKGNPNNIFALFAGMKAMVGNKPIREGLIFHIIWMKVFILANSPVGHAPPFSGPPKYIPF